MPREPSPGRGNANEDRGETLVDEAIQARGADRERVSEFTPGEKPFRRWGGRGDGVDSLRATHSGSLLAFRACDTPAAERGVR